MSFCLKDILIVIFGGLFWNESLICVKDNKLPNNTLQRFFIHYYIRTENKKVLSVFFVIKNKIAIRLLNELILALIIAMLITEKEISFNAHNSIAYIKTLQLSYINIINWLPLKIHQVSL